MLEQLELQIIASLQGLFDQFGWLGVAAILAFENATGITPSEIILGLAGWMLIEAHGLPLSFIFLAGVYAALGSTLGASVTYWVARLGGRPVIERMARWFRIDTEHITRSENLFHKWGPGLVLFGRMMPGVRTLVSIPAGLARMSYPVFALTTAIGTYLWCTLLLGVGFFLGEEWPIIRELVYAYLPYIFGVAAVAGAIALVVYYRRNIFASLGIREPAQ